MDSTRTITDDPAERREINREREALRRLELLLVENAAFEKKDSGSFQIGSKSQAVTTPGAVSTETAVAQLGLLTGAIPTSAIFIKLLFDGPGNADPAGAVALTLIILISIAATSAAGYFSGKLTGRILSDLEQKPWPLMILALPFVGTTWGLISGAAGGFILLGIGSIFGGAIGAVVGAIVLTAFGLLHRAVKKGDEIERSQYIPIAIGITSVVAAFILGL